MHVDVAAAASGQRAAARPRARRRGCCASGAAGGRALPPRRRSAARPLPKLAERALRPRRPRGGLVPHGHGQPRERARRLRRRDAGWARVYFDATPRNHRARTGCCPASATTPPPISGVSTRRGRSCVSTATTPTSCVAVRGCRPPRPPPRRCSIRESQTEVFETPGDLEDAYRSGELRPFEGVPGMRLDPQAGELAERLDADRSSTGACVPRPTSSRCIWRPACATCRAPGGRSR